MHGWWTASYVVLWLLVLALALLVLALARQVGTLHLRLGPRGALEVDGEGPALGDAPEPIDVSDLDGRPVAVGGPGAAQLLLFVSPGCPVCHDVMPSVGAAARGGGLAPLLIADARAEDARHLLADRRIDAPLVPAPDLAERYSIPGTPFAVILDDLGVVRAKGTVNNLEQLEGLVDTAKRRAAQPVGVAPE
jgi:methylamine dehydrogenase accessory protein MauD